MSRSWLIPECEDCEHFSFNFSFGFVESKECSLSPLEECPFKKEDNYIKEKEYNG